MRHALQAAAPNRRDPGHCGRPCAIAGALSPAAIGAGPRRRASGRRAARRAAHGSWIRTDPRISLETMQKPDGSGRSSSCGS